MDHLTKGTTNLIERLGNTLEVMTRYSSERPAGGGTARILLVDPEGLFVGAKLQIGSQEHLVTGLNGRFVDFSPPLSAPLLWSSPIFTRYQTHGLPIQRRESSLRLRLPANVVIIPGSIVRWAEQRFFILEIKPWDTSKEVLLQEINVSVDLLRLEGLEESILLLNLPASLTHNTTDSPLIAGIGYLRTGHFQCLIAKTTPVDITPGDLVRCNDTRYKVVGLDNFSHKNLVSLSLTYESP